MLTPTPCWNIKLNKTFPIIQHDDVLPFFPVFFVKTKHSKQGEVSERNKLEIFRELKETKR